MNIPEQDIDKLLTEFCRAEVERAPRQHRLGWQDWPPLARTRSIWVGPSGCTSSTASIAHASQRRNSSHAPLWALLDYPSLMSPSPEMPSYLTSCRTCRL